MAVNPNLGVAHCMPSVQPENSMLRDMKDPLVLMTGLLGIGCSVDAAEDMVRHYYRMQVLGKGGGEESQAIGTQPTSSSGVSQLSSRSARSKRFFEECDKWLTMDGYCYTTLLRPSRRGSYARCYGKDIKLDAIFKFLPEDIVWGRLSEVRVVRIDNWHVHFSFGDVEGSFSMMEHMAAFAADFPVLVPSHWLEALKHVKPAEDGCFGMTTIFGKLLVDTNTRIENDASVEFDFDGFNVRSSSYDAEMLFRLSFEDSPTDSEFDTIWDGHSMSDGFCYTAVLTFSSRSEVASRVGPEIDISALFQLPTEQISWQDLSQIRVKRNQGTALCHMSMDDMPDSCGLLPLLVDFFSDYGYLGDHNWASILDDVSPAGLHWFTMDTRFGADIDDGSLMRVIYTGSDKRVTYTGHDVIYPIQQGEYVEITVPKGGVVDDGFTIVADARVSEVRVLLTASSKFYVFGISALELRARIVHDVASYASLLEAKNFLMEKSGGLPPLILSARKKVLSVVALGFDSDRMLWTNVANSVARVGFRGSLEVVAVMANACVVRSYEVPGTGGISLLTRSCREYYRSLLKTGTLSGVFIANVSSLLDQVVSDGICSCGYDCKSDKLLLNQHLNVVLGSLSDGMKWRVLYVSDSNLPKVQYAVVER